MGGKDMARKSAGAVLDPETEGTTDTGAEEGAQDAPLEGMEDVSAEEIVEENGDDKRPKPPTELRTVFNEIARLSGILGLARKAVYANDIEKVVKALRLLASQAPAAAEVAELTAP